MCFVPLMLAGKGKDGWGWGSVLSPPPAYLQSRLQSSNLSAEICRLVLGRSGRLVQ